MADIAGRKKNKDDAPGSQLVAGDAEPPSVAPDAEPDAHLVPFAKPFNDYFAAVQDAGQTVRHRAIDTYDAYVKASRAAIDARDADAFKAAAESFGTAWSELGTSMASNVGLAFDKYHDDMKAAFASGASSTLGAGCLILVARSIATVAWHRTFYQRA